MFLSVNCGRDKDEISILNHKNGGKSGKQRVNIDVRKISEMLSYEDEAAIRILEQIQVNFKYDDTDQNFKFSLIANALLNQSLCDKLTQMMNPEEYKNEEPQDGQG